MGNTSDNKRQIVAFNPQTTLGHKLRIISIYTDRYFHFMKEQNTVALPRGQGPMLGYLVDHADEVICQIDLERAFSVSGATVSNMLSSMEKAGLIERVQMEGDGRRKQIVPTEQGINQENEARRQIIQLEEGMVRGFSEEERARFREYLNRAAENINTLCREKQVSES